MRREINGRSLPVSADGICITGAHYFYSTVVLPNHIFESHQHKVETIQSNRRKNEPRLPLLGCRLSKAGMCAKTSRSSTKWRRENCAVVATHVP